MHNFYNPQWHIKLEIKQAFILSESDLNHVILISLLQNLWRKLSQLVNRVINDIICVLMQLETCFQHKLYASPVQFKPWCCRVSFKTSTSDALTEDLKCCVCWSGKHEKVGNIRELPNVYARILFIPKKEKNTSAKWASRYLNDTLKIHLSQSRLIFRTQDTQMRSTTTTNKMGKNKNRKSRQEGN